MGIYLVGVYESSIFYFIFCPFVVHTPILLNSCLFVCTWGYSLENNESWGLSLRFVKAAGTQLFQQASNQNSLLELEESKHWTTNN